MSIIVCIEVESRARKKEYAGQKEWLRWSVTTCRTIDGRVQTIVRFHIALFLSPFFFFEIYIRHRDGTGCGIRTVRVCWVARNKRIILMYCLWRRRFISSHYWPAYRLRRPHGQRVILPECLQKSLVSRLGPSALITYISFLSRFPTDNPDAQNCPVTKYQNQIGINKFILTICQVSTYKDTIDWPVIYIISIPLGFKAPTNIECSSRRCTGTVHVILCKVANTPTRPKELGVWAIIPEKFDRRIVSLSPTTEPSDPNHWDLQAPRVSITVIWRN